MQSSVDLPTVPAGRRSARSLIPFSLDPPFAPAILGAHEVFPNFCYSLAQVMRGAGSRSRRRCWR